MTVTPDDLIAAADLCRVNVAVSVLLQHAIILAEDEAREDDALVSACAGAQLLDVIVRVGSIADD